MNKATLKSIEDAFDLKRKGYYKQAIEVYYKLLSSEGDNLEILSEIADLYLELGNYERTLHYTTKSLEIDPSHVRSLKLVQKVYEKQGKFKEAVDVAKDIYDKTNSDDDLKNLLEILSEQHNYDEILSLTETVDDIDCLYHRTLALFHSGRKDDAISLYEKLRTRSDFYEDEYGSLLELTGKVYLEQNKMKEAKEVFEKLEENNMQTAESLNYIGLNKLDELKLDEAIEYFNQASAQDDKNSQYVYNMGQAYFLKGWFDEAQKCFNTAICLNPMEEKYHYSLAYLHYKSGNYELAQNHLNPEYFESRVLLQVIKSEKGDLASPKVELEKMLKEYPDNETILYSLAKIYFNLDMFRQAKTIIEKVVEINPKSFDYQTFDVRLMLRLDMLEDAEKRINMLLEKYPKYYYAHVLEAELYLAQKDYESLFDTAQELIELDCNHYEGYYYNALALFEKEDINFAIESLKKAISLDVDNADLYVKMSEFYQAIGRYEDAFAYIKEASDIDKSAKNQELYMQLAGILRRKGISQE